MLKDSFLAFMRHALTTAAGAFGATSYSSGDELTAVISGATALAGIIWSLVDKKMKAVAAK